MGLFSFLSRKSGRGKATASLKRHPYSSVASDHRLNQDGLPVTGNETIVESLSGGRSNFSQSQLSLDTVSGDEVPAPAPSIPRFRDESLERPSTAPSSGSPSVTLSGSPRVTRNGQRKPPPVSFRMTRPETATPTSRPGSRGSVSSITNVFRKTSRRSRASSLRSDGVRAFKDILDAQFEIRPPDFRARVEAAGARDYGEDVAERNMGQNGVELESEHVQAFYAQSKGAESETIQFLPTGPPLSPHKAGVRRLSLRSTSQYSFPRRLSSQSPVPSTPMPSRALYSARRRSVNTYMPSSFGDWSFPARLKPDCLEEVSPRTPVAEVDMDFGVSALRLHSPVMPQLPEAAPAPVIRTNRLPRDSVELAKRRAESPMAEDGVKHDSPATDFATWSATRSRRSSTLLSATSSHGKHRSLYTLRSSVSSSILSRDSLTHATPLSYPPKPAFHEQVQDVPERSSSLDSASVEPVAFSLGPPFRPTSAIPRIREDEGETHSPPPQRFSLAPTKEPNTADITLPDDDILDYPPPIRTRSMRGWSASSSTPTVSESTIAASVMTKSTFNRPHSLHTADTSVDLSVGARSPDHKHAKSIAHDSDASDSDPYDNNATAEHTLRRPDTACVDAFSVDGYISAASSDSYAPNDDNRNQSNDHKPNHEDRINADTFNIDDYLSSDAESLTAATTRSSSRRPTGEGEEELLFNETGWMQLPGLADVFGRETGTKKKRNTTGDTAGKVKAAVSVAVSPSPLPLERLLADIPTGEFQSGMGMRYDEGEVRKRRVSAGAAGRLPGKDTRTRTRTRKTAHRRVKKFVLDTAADGQQDDDYDTESSWEESRIGLRGSDENVSDGGYEADYVEDESEGAARRRRRYGMNRARRLSVPHVMNDKHAEQDRQLDLPKEEKEKQEHEHNMEADLEDKIAAAIRLRKQIKRAKRLAGQPSPAAQRRMEPRMSVPVVRVENAI